ncbi:hypothetical protein Pint_15144 [Pistacia integerrima]|uniref:Uncharacterized protein n=1 Tax=Pistacia integerrima TaxID=434235 RepID=A0ACC0ZAY1_9ROSI|nr:hypothetical protein Pint_15144 [Pistacia integerrima]
MWRACKEGQVMALRITSGSYYRGTILTALLLLFSGVTINGLEDQNMADLELDEQLKILNKPYVKSIKTEEGDTFDCVNIHKQPAFDHPVLENHKLQYAVKILTNTPNRKYLGASGQVNIQNPKIPEGQFSEALIRLQSGSEDQIDGIQVGWMVNPTLYGDNRTRTFTLWTAGRNGCYDIMCPGFVQVNPKLSLSSTFTRISVFGGKQYDFTFTVSQDPKSGNWWLKYKRENIGYWPNSLFTHLSSSGATEITWGGGAFSGGISNSPPMGTGHFAEANYGKAAYIRQLKVADEFNRLRYPDKSLFKLFTDCTCYDLYALTGPLGEGFGFLYGGPGGCGP